jgi:hypothetical protein
MVFTVASNNCASRAVLNLAVHATTIAQLQSPLVINSVSETAWAYPVAARRFACGRASFRLDSQFRADLNVGRVKRGSSMLGFSSSQIGSA